MAPRRSSTLRVLADQWSGLTHYERFESGVALALTLVIMLVIAVARALGVTDWRRRERDDRLRSATATDAPPAESPA